MLDFITALWLGVVGASIGSFLNVVAYRMPLGMSVVWKPSHCPRCEHAIRPRDNVPVLGWLALRGRCRDCGEPISPRYAIVEGMMGLAFFTLGYVELFSGGANLAGGPVVTVRGAWEVVWTPQWALLTIFAYHCALMCLAMTVSLIDLDGNRIPTTLRVITALALAALPLLPMPAAVHQQLAAANYFPWQAAAAIGLALAAILRRASGNGRSNDAAPARRRMNLAYSLWILAAAAVSLVPLIVGLCLLAFPRKVSQLPAVGPLTAHRWAVPAVSLAAACALFIAS